MRWVTAMLKRAVLAILGALLVVITWRFCVRVVHLPSVQWPLGIVSSGQLMVSRWCSRQRGPEVWLRWTLTYYRRIHSAALRGEVLFLKRKKKRWRAEVSLTLNTHHRSYLSLLPLRPIIFWWPAYKHALMPEMNLPRLDTQAAALVSHSCLMQHHKLKTAVYLL